MAKQLVFQNRARHHIKAGVDMLANAVKTTLGPKGRNVALDTKWGTPTITHDGVTVAREIELEEPFQNMGARLLCEAATKTNDATGDGTTTATVLAQAIVHEGLRNIVAGANPMLIKWGIESGRDAVVAALRDLAIPVETRDQIAQVAAISAADAQIGELISGVMDKVGKDGVITVEESKGLQFETEYVEGMQIEHGFLSPYFITNSERMEAVVESPYILLHDRRISSAQDLLPILEKLLQVGSRDLVIVAEDVDGDALATLVLNKLRGNLNVVAVKAPGFGDRRKEMLRDIAVLTGGQVITEELGRRLTTAELSDLGQADKVVSIRENTTIVGGRGEQDEIRSRIDAIRAEIEKATGDYDREKLQERLAKLAGGVAVIRVGASTETELKEKKHRVEDALSATRAAVEEGIVPGGGVALLNVLPALDQVQPRDRDAAVGVQILRRALEEPLRMIVGNAGHDGAVVLERVRELHTRGEHNYGYDVMSEHYCDMLAAGIIDPVKVTRCAFENACSIAAMILTTEALVTDVPEHKPTPTPESDEAIYDEF